MSCVFIGAYAARLAGATTGRIAISMSFFNLISMFSRLSAFFYTPMLGALSDHAARAGEAAITLFQWQLRTIVFAGAVGAALGTLLIPTFTIWFVRGIRSFERSGSLPRVTLQMFVPRTAFSMLSSFQSPGPDVFGGLNLKYVSPHLLGFNVLTTAVYAIGMISATYASVLDPASARTALLSTGLVNAVAMASFVFVVDPASAHMTDLAVKGERSVDDVRRLMIFLSLTTIVGTLAAQFLLVPAAYFVVTAVRLFTAR